MFTAQEFARLPNHLDGKDELYRGRIEKQPFGSFSHGVCVGKIVAALGQFQDSILDCRIAIGCGIIVEREPDSVFAPDISVWPSCLKLVNPMNWPETPPVLVVEVADSIHDFLAHIMYKTPIYLAFGVQLIWNVRPRWRVIDVYRLSSQPKPFDELHWRNKNWQPNASLGLESVLSGEDVLPDFRCRVADIIV